ncbi:ATP phosphoribosyltransferase regulatory subunit [Paracoccaceae bacterium]|nr:ATP phosphoribosyltransferase regulatory subunit [Paracoccaceae bacterium]
MVNSQKGIKKNISDFNNLGLEINRISRIMKKAGLYEIKVPSLLTASDLVDLYGEDLKLRAYTTSDPVKGEQVLRPDFTLPILLKHLRGNSLKARYFYSGNVWRRQNFKSVVPNEQYQMGFEFFDNKKNNSISLDVEAFLLINKILRKYEVNAVTGDVQILSSALEELDISAYKKASLKRHLWRPKRFMQLLDLYSDQKKNLRNNFFFKGTSAAIGKKKLNEIESAYGVRTKEDIEERIETLQQELSKNLISQSQKTFLISLMQYQSTLSDASRNMLSLADVGSKYRKAIDNFESRVGLLSEHVNTSKIKFQVIYGLTTLEYYDGFVFGFQFDRGNYPPIAQGGRYDGLCSILSRKRKSIHAIGSMVRMDLLN